MSENPYVLRLQAAHIDAEVWHMQLRACEMRARATLLEMREEEAREEREDVREFERVSGLRVSA